MALYLFVRYYILEIYYRLNFFLEERVHGCLPIFFRLHTVLDNSLNHLLHLLQQGQILHHGYILEHSPEYHSLHSTEFLLICVQRLQREFVDYHICWQHLLTYAVPKNY